MMKTLVMMVLLLVGSAAVADTWLEPRAGVVQRSEVIWDQLNPARGDQSPRAGTLWGDRKGEGATGFLFNPVHGFQSPPHIHNVSYRGIVISGLVHNDDANADEMWMPQCSFWTQPKGSPHITSARGDDTLAYIEIEEGPYLVYPTDQRFESQEFPLNVHASNLVWVGLDEVPRSAQGAEIAYLWEQAEQGPARGILLKLPAGASLRVGSPGFTVRAVVVQGRIRYQMSDQSGPMDLEPGSYFWSADETVHQVENDTDSSTVIYLRLEGDLELGELP